MVVKVTIFSYICNLFETPNFCIMEYESLIYKGREIKIVQKENEEYFPGCYVNTIWFPDLERARNFIDRMTAHQEMNSL